MDEVAPTMDLRATHLEAPDEFSKAHQLNALKAVHAQRFGIAKDSDRGGMLQKTMAAEPLVRDQLSMKRVFTVNGVQVPIPGGTPNDNTIAFGDSVVMTAVNSVIWAWDLRKDTFLFPQQFIPLVAASGYKLRPEPATHACCMTPLPSAGFCCFCGKQSRCEPNRGLL